MTRLDEVGMMVAMRKHVITAGLQEGMCPLPVADTCIPGPLKQRPGTALREANPTGQAAFRW